MNAFVIWFKAWFAAFALKFVKTNIEQTGDQILSDQIEPKVVKPTAVMPKGAFHLKTFTIGATIDLIIVDNDDTLMQAIDACGLTDRVSNYFDSKRAVFVQEKDKGFKVLKEVPALTAFFAGLAVGWVSLMAVIFLR